MIDEKKKRSIIVSAVITVVILLVIVLIAVIIDARRSATIDILVTPKSAKIVLDGKEYQNGTYAMEPSVVSFMIEKDGFKSQSGEIELKENEVVKLYTYLIPENGSLDWYLNHEEDQMILNTIGDDSANRDSAIYLLENPIVSVLPMIYARYDDNWNYTEYRVDGGTFAGCESSFCLQITDTTGGNYEVALNAIRDAGFDPSNYEILYKYKPIVQLEEK